MLEEEQYARFVEEFERVPSAVTEGRMLPLEMNAPEQMCSMPIVGSGTMLSFPHAEFPQDFLDQLEYLRLPSQLFFQGTDHSFLVGRTMTTCIWVPLVFL